MQYMLLIVEPTTQRQERGLEGGQQAYQAMLDYTASLRERGVLVASNSLSSTRSGQRLQVRDGRSTLIDGPFTETKEMVGGFFLVECDSRDQAAALAAQCPAAQWATVEIRAVGPCYE